VGFNVSHVKNPWFEWVPDLFLSVVCSGPGTARCFGGGGRNGFRSRVAEGHENLGRAIRITRSQMLHGFPKGLNPKVILALRPIHPIQKSRQIDQLMPGVHKIHIQHLLTCHCVHDVGEYIAPLGWEKL
jgi:hypothetical protein